MTMKSSDLQKSLGSKINSKLGASGQPDRFGAAAGKGADKRKQRAQDRALGLVPFACKLPSTLVKDLQARAAAHEGGINALMAEIVAKGIAAAK